MTLIGTAEIDLGPHSGKTINRFEHYVFQRDSRGFIEGTKENPLVIEGLTNEELDWIFKGIPYGATIGMRALWDEVQPARESKETVYCSRGKYEAYELQNRLEGIK